MDPKPTGVKKPGTISPVPGKLPESRQQNVAKTIVNIRPKIV